jgi:hypothetical protein
MDKMMAFNELATQLGSGIVRQQFKALNDLTQSCADQLHQLSMAKGIDDVMATQSRFISKSSPRVIGHAQDTLDCIMDAAAQYRKLLEKSFQSQQEKN